MKRERDKLDRTLGGIREMTRTPSAVWIVDTNKEHLAVEEARKLRIPIIGILDTNCDPDEVDFAIPGNDDAIRAVGLLTRVIADAVAEGLKARAGVKSDGDAHIGAEEPLAEWEASCWPLPMTPKRPSSVRPLSRSPLRDPVPVDGPAVDETRSRPTKPRLAVSDAPIALGRRARGRCRERRRPTGRRGAGRCGTRPTFPRRLP